MEQLQLDLLSAAEAPRPRVVASAVMRRHRLCNEVLRRVFYVRRYFPELEGQTLTVGLTRAASGMAVPGSNRIWLNPSRLTYHTIAHELVHLLQRRNLSIPSGERACDVFSLARHWTLNDDRPTYIKVPVDLLDDRGRLAGASARLVFEVAHEAVVLRGRGMRTYASFFEHELRRRTRSEPRYLIRSIFRAAAPGAPSSR